MRVFRWFTTEKQWIKLGAEEILYIIEISIIYSTAIMTEVVRTRPETRGWRERIETLQFTLEREVVNFIKMCEGSDSGKNEALVRAVGEIIDARQENARRLS